MLPYKNLLRVITVLVMFSLLSSGLSGTIASAKSPAPKNIIIMISDGMGYNTNLAASYYQYGEADKQVYHRFPFQFFMSTYSAAQGMNPTSADPCYGKVNYDPAAAWASFDYVKFCPTDSAAAATAMAAGVKTYNAAINVDLYGKPVENIIDRAEKLGKATGVVSSVQLSHATPAGFVAHNTSRNSYEAIANEMIFMSQVEVIMGLGNPWFDDNGIKRSATTNNHYRYVGGKATWDTLVGGTAVGADADQDGQPDAWVLIQTREEFQNLASGPTPKRLIGVPQAHTTLQQSRAGDGNADPFVVPMTPTVPTLPEMTQAALNVLDNDPDGFVVMIEGGAVDWAGHANQPGRIIEEQMDFDLAVETVVDWVKENSNWGETLLIITGDHETGYVTGPESGANGAAIWNAVVNNGAGVLPGMQFNSGDHTNTLIPFYAKGDDARWFTKAVVGEDPVYGRYIDNTDIAKVIFQLLSGK
jgi:alkaline phosphatase